MYLSWTSDGQLVAKNVPFLTYLINLRKTYSKNQRFPYLGRCYQSINTSTETFLYSKNAIGPEKLFYTHTNTEIYL